MIEEVTVGINHAWAPDDSQLLWFESAGTYVEVKVIINVDTVRQQLDLQNLEPHMYRIHTLMLCLADFGNVKGHLNVLKDGAVNPMQLLDELFNLCVEANPKLALGMNPNPFGDEEDIL